MRVMCGTQVMRVCMRECYVLDVTRVCRARYVCNVRYVCTLCVSCVYVMYVCMYECNACMDVICVVYVCAYDWSDRY